MNRTRVGTDCLIAAVAGFIALGTLAYFAGSFNGLFLAATEEMQMRELELRNPCSGAPVFLGVLSLLPLSLFVIGLRLHKAQFTALAGGITSEERASGEQPKGSGSPPAAWFFRCIVGAGFGLVGGFPVAILASVTAFNLYCASEAKDPDEVFGFMPWMLWSGFGSWGLVTWLAGVWVVSTWWKENAPTHSPATS